jgi:FlaA1/EpsC-like NDP-sugar epimerase
VVPGETSPAVTLLQNTPGFKQSGTKTDAAVRLLYQHRRLVATLIYGLVAAAAFRLAFMLRFDFNEPPEMLVLVQAALPALVAVRLLIDTLFGLGNSRWRFAGTHDVYQLLAASVVGTAVFFLLSWGLQLVPQVPRSVLVIECILSSYGTAGVWLVYRTLVERVRRFRHSTNGSTKRVLIVGAGEAGSLLAREMVRTPTGYRPLGFIDDDRNKLNTRVHGLPVLGITAQIRAIAEREGAQEIVIAAPSASPADMRRIVELCRESHLDFKVLPGIATVLAGQVRLHYLRELRIEDLLGREPITLELPELYEDLRGRTVMITGAAGSIGAELSRQVAMHDPGLLVLVDQAETPLFYLEQELREKFPRLNATFAIADIVDRVCIDRLFSDFQPSSVYHAAAYKHVSMMQVNAREALRNNVLGTWIVGVAAGRHAVEKFVLVSSDKAVRPSNVMGASKRLAEIATLELQRRFPSTTFNAVRFGNVLGSNGSVIPIFQRQLDEGKPLTVTDPNCTRYFMTIPEAVHLILQATLLRDMKGRIAMLEMGEPMRILELAKTMLRLFGGPERSGPGIVFTGLRSGEKLHEELLDSEEETVPTTVPKVRLVVPAANAPSLVPRWLEQMELWLDKVDDSEIVEFLRAVFPTIEVSSANGRLKVNLLGSTVVRSEEPLTAVLRDTPIKPVSLG